MSEGIRVFPERLNPNEKLLIPERLPSAIVESYVRENILATSGQED